MEWQTHDTGDPNASVHDVSNPNPSPIAGVRLRIPLPASGITRENGLRYSVVMTLTAAALPMESTTQVRRVWHLVAVSSNTHDRGEVRLTHDNQSCASSSESNK